MPLDCEAYCRILPPLHVSVLGRQEWWRWADYLGLARRSGLPGQLVRDFLLTRTSWHAADVRAQALVGSARRETISSLVDVLCSWTAKSVECVYYYWSGRALVGQTPGHHVYRGPLHAATELQAHGSVGATGVVSRYESPTAFWPDGMAWAFAMHTDSPAAYLGGSSAVVDDVVGTASLEATSVAASTRVDDWTDRSAWQLVP